MSNLPATQSPPPGKIEFVQSHEPPLEAGDYAITVEQEITAGSEISYNNSFKATQAFAVYGERFAFRPADIHAVFPPAGSLGDHANVLPHIALKRSTLPWERRPNDDGNLPWLTLLLFNEDEAARLKTQIATLQDLAPRSSSSPLWPGVKLETGEAPTDKAVVIDVPFSLLNDIMPTAADLQYLAHVRQATEGDGRPVGDGQAVVVGNRLPAKGGVSTVHLVSVEGRYNSSGFDYQGATDGDAIRLVSLKSWKFSCLEEQHSFQGLLDNINRDPSTLRLPPNRNAHAEKYLAMGYVPLQQHMRQGDKTVSWYHGPLAPGQNPDTTLALPVRAADELVRYNPADGLFDISYAAAWELGRLLALASRNLSTSLYNWKRAHAQLLKRAEQQLLHPHLADDGPPHGAAAIPDNIASWFADLSLLRGIPFDYLVPDEAMCPQESIRFFWIDPRWMECLLDGAFSIGRVTAAAYKKDGGQTPKPADNPYGTVTGFLLRSTVVAGWPDLEVDGYDQVMYNGDLVPDGDRLQLLRMDRLSANVLICLFAGEVKTVDIHQKPEALHSGFDIDKSGGYFKTLRNNKGVEDQSVKIPNKTLATFPWDAQSRVVRIGQLAADIETTLKDNHIEFSSFTSAQFALEMIEGVQKVRFAMGKTGP